jgi:hypothetical protein
MHCDSALAPRPGGALGHSYASSGHSRNDWRSVVLSHLGTFMPKLDAASGGRYGAYLSFTYAVVLGLAEIVTLRATP